MNFRDWYDSEEVDILENNGPPCPKCGAPMVLRKNSQNGNQFYGCSTFGRTGCKGSGAYNPNYKKPVEQQPQVKQVAQTPTVAQTPASRVWIYAKITKKGDKRFPVFGKEIAASKRQDGNWDYIVLDNPQDKGLIYNDEISNGLIQSLRDIKTGKSLTSQNPSLEDLEQKFSSIGQEESPNQEQPNQEKPKPEEKKNNKTIPEHQISPEQSAIDERFQQIISGKEQQHIMINALAGTGKTTMLKHLAWKYGKPGQKWLYIVFNTKNKIEASDSVKGFPTNFVDVRTSNGFLGELLGSPANLNRIPQTERVASLNNSQDEGKIEKSRLVADSPEFGALMENLGLVEKVGNYDYGKLSSNINSLLKDMRYNFKESVLTLVGLAKSYSLDPRNQSALNEGIIKLLESYDIDTELINVKERIAKSKSSYYVDSITQYLEDILGFDFMTKDFRNEIIQSTTWMMNQLMPSVSKVMYGQGRMARQLSGYRDFDDDLWYAATHANQLVWPRYDVVLADEVQDFNENQKIMLQKLSEAGAKIVAVGDPNQAIYRFRGADGQAFNNLKNALGNMSQGDSQVVYGLTKNFRSRPEILDFANQETHVKDLKSGKEFKDGIKGVVTKGELKYNNVIDELGNEVQQSRGKMPKQTAFISRTNEPLVKAALALMAKKIPFIIMGRDIAKDLNKHIKTVCNKRRLRDNDSSRTLAAELSGYLDDEKGTYGGKSTKKEYLNELDQITEALIGCVETYESESGGTGGDIAGFRDWIFNRLGGIEINEGSERNVAANLAKYNKMIEDQNPVILTTAHKSKGLEFSRVYILRYDQFPHPKAVKSGNEEELQQEENSRYVALTRAQDELHILDLENQPGYKSNSGKKTSMEPPVSDQKKW